MHFIHSYIKNVSVWDPTAHFKHRWVRICILEGTEDGYIRIETCCPNTIINIIKFCCVWYIVVYLYNCIFIYVFTKPSHATRLSHYPIYWRSVLILYSPQIIRLPGCLFATVFQIKVLLCLTDTSLYIYIRVHKTQSRNQNLSLPYLWKIRFNIIFPSNHTSPRLSLRYSFFSD